MDDPNEYELPDEYYDKHSSCCIETCDNSKWGTPLWGETEFMQEHPTKAAEYICDKCVESLLYHEKGDTPGYTPRTLEELTAPQRSRCIKK